MSKENGWKPMPLALKIIFVFIAIGVLFSAPALFAAGVTGYSVLGFFLSGIPATLAALFFVALSAVILYGMWTRATWAGTMAIAYYSYFALNTLLSIPSAKKIIETSLEGTKTVAGVTEVMNASLYTGIAIGVLLNLVIIAFFVKHRAYFK